jgi:hypothetical protein
MIPGRLNSLVLTLALAMGCNTKPPIFGPGSGGGEGGEGDGTVDTGPKPDTGDTGEEPEASSFEDPGDVVGFTDQTGRADVVLADASGESNEGQEFYYVLVNSGTSEIGYELYYEDSGPIETSGRSVPPNRSRARSKPPVSPQRAILEDAVLAGDLRRPALPDAPPPAFEDADVGVARSEFRVRSSSTEEGTYSRVYAKLWAVGEKVNIWVDVDVPIDWDYTCDGAVDLADGRGAYGFDNCDLQKIADIVDTNIFPHVTSVFGEVSDINEDERVSVVITPVLNYMTAGLEDEEDRATLVGSYAEPAVDLTDYDADTNPGSDEQEVIYVFAPDPYGFYNPFATTTVEEYTSMGLAAEIARALSRLISYNMHILEGGTEDDEETWLSEGLGAMAADLCGFGAVYYDDVWDYLDAPHLVSLIDSETTGDINSGSWGAQYLFLRWLTDVYGPELLTQLMASGLTGKTNVESALGVFADESSFDKAVVLWHIAMLTSGVTNAAGEPLVPIDLFPPYQSPSFISAPVTNPTSGDYYGANGYQTGINVGGANLYFEDGTTSTPVENEENSVLLSHTDHATMVAGFPFYGYAAADYGVHVVRLTGIPYTGATLMIQGSSANYLGAVVRWNDPSRIDWVKETSFSSSEAGTTPLPALDGVGSTVYGIGEVKDSVTTVIVAADEDDNADATVYDTDRWLLDLSAYSPTDTVTVAIHLNRQFTSLSGDMGLEDPWISVVPASWLPNPTVSGTRACSDAEAISFGYPTSVLDYLYYQIFLSTTASEVAGTEEEGAAEDTGLVTEDVFDPCGVISEAPTTCANDWDLDGVLDEVEPRPATFVEQVQVMQCTLAGGDITAFTPASDKIIDQDERDDNEESYFDRTLNIGGKNGSSGEEAFLMKELQGGTDYVIVVGATAGLGTYELRVTQTE